MKAAKKAPAREDDELIMLDGRRFFTHDNWTTVYVTSRDGGPPRKLTGSAADRVRLLAVAQSSAGP